MRGATPGMAVLAALWGCLLATGPGVQAQVVRDPGLDWRTVRTPHFDIHYHEPLAMVARRVAAVAERAHGPLAETLAHEPRHRTQVVLTDIFEHANGSATALPYNTIRLFAASPEDLSTLGDYDDWLTLLVTHEHTHILHMDNIGGIPGIINAIFGKVYAPNQVQPRWVTEGFATFEESRRTAGGRLRSTMFDMFMRMEALEDRFLTIDQLSTVPDRWPRATSWYLYGSRFVAFLVDRFGDDVLADISEQYGKGPLPYGLNRVAKRATGHTFTDLYDQFLEAQRQHHGQVAARVREQGVVAGERLTHHGETVRSPDFWDDDTIVYQVADGRSDAQLRAVDAHTGERLEKICRVNGLGYWSPAPDGRHFYYAQQDNHRDTFRLYDLFRFDRHRSRRTRLTRGLRARYPHVSRDGRRIVFTVSNAGTSHLMIADTDDVEGSRRLLLRNPRFEQVYTPRFSPNGRQVAFSHWREGGYRDIRVLDLESGTIQDVTRDRALDTGPTWSPDGRTLYFSSDRTGIANIYAWTVETGALRQVTNVLSGAYHPAVSPDGRRMVYLGYSTLGFDLWTLDLDPSSFRPATPYVDDRPSPSPADETLPLRSRRYNPVPTLLPRFWELNVIQGAFGTELGARLSGQDAAEWHRYTGILSVPVQEGFINADVSYWYQRLPTNMRLRLFRRLRPRGGLVVGGEGIPWIENHRGGELGLSRTFPRTFHRNTVQATYALSHVGSLEPFGGRLDPNTPPPVVPDRGRLASLRLGWSISDVRRQVWDISPSMGRTVSVSLNVSDPLVGSRFRTTSLSWAGTQYVPVPGLDLHVLAIRYGGGISAGEVAGRGVFSVGGFPDAPLHEAILDDMILGGVALRGYAPFSRMGTQFHLVQTEYRFPIVRPQFGVKTLPFFVNRMYGAFFVDYGDAFSGSLDLSTFRVGTGAEILTDFTLGYFVQLTLRTGVAWGFHEGGGFQYYANIGVPF
jgi:hypothetical protein